MKQIQAFETTDGERYFDEHEARSNQRRINYAALLDATIKEDPNFARFDRDLMLDFLMHYGTSIGRTADAPIMPNVRPKTTIINAMEGPRREALAAAQEPSPERPDAKVMEDKLAEALVSKEI